MRLYWPKETPPSILPPGKGRGSRRVWLRLRSDIIGAKLPSRELERVVRQFATWKFRSRVNW